MVAIITAFGLVVAVIVPTEHKGEAAQTASSTTYKVSEEQNNTLLDSTLLASSLIGNLTLEHDNQTLAAKSSEEVQGFAVNNLSAEAADVEATDEELSDIFSLAPTDEQSTEIKEEVKEEVKTELVNETQAEDTEKADAAKEDEEPAPDFYNVGVRHSSVAEIQQRLMDLGFMDYAEPTDYYGNITAQSVMLFQRQNDLKQDGIIGPETKALLLSDNAKKYTAKLGMSGDDIARIQTRLYEMGYIASSDQITGTFDETTEKAVIKMQTNNGISADGKVGLVTAELIYSGEAKANLLSYGDKSEIILEAQQRLKELGYLTTTPDGSYGKDTEAAVKQFQSRNDLVVDGFLGPTTRDVLNSSGAVANGLMLGDSGDTVQRVQELLHKYGYISADNATGYFGEVTESAVKAFQRNNGLTADGNVGVMTMSKLTGSDVVKASSSDNSNSGNNTDSGNSNNNNNNNSNSGNDNSSDSDNNQGNSASVSALLDVARSKLGSPYVYGSKGPNSFDCSGFVYYCLNQIGVKQSYITSAGWRNIGKYQKVTNFSSIKAGDIVVVRGHVGIAAGNGMVIDASSSSGKIVYRDLGSWWSSNFIVAWRIFG
jgi:peptidoglycan hydrolase-like protein with peptidoglycan-binding domain